MDAVVFGEFCQQMTEQIRHERKHGKDDCLDVDCFKKPKDNDVLFTKPASPSKTTTDI